MNLLSTDFHVHAGCERGPRAQAEFVAALLARGVTLAGLCDHAEFYFPQQSQWHVDFRKAAADKGLSLYPPSLDGLREFYRDLCELRRTSSLRFAMGLEICKVAETPEAFLEHPQYLSLCSNIRDNPMGEGFGKALAERIRAFAARIRPAAKRGIVNHPFRDRFGAFRDAMNAGQSVPPISKYVTRDDLCRIADAAGECGLFLEVNIGALGFYSKWDVVRDLVRHTLALLRETTVDLCVGSDSHKPPEPQFPPELLETLQQADLPDSRFSRARQVMEALAV